MTLKEAMSARPRDPEPSGARKASAEDITFLMVGCQRCGSTWVDRALRGHPEIHLPPQKQTYFFDSNYDDGMEWYLEQYGPLKPGAKAVGEIATSYCLTDILPRVARELPHIKIIMSVREPVARALSYYNSRKVKFGWTSLDEAIKDDPLIIERGQYADQIETILKHFPKDRFLLLFYDDLVADDRAYLKTILRFLEVDEDYDSPALGQKIQVSAFGRSRRLARKMGAGRLVDMISASPAGDMLRRRLARQSSARQSSARTGTGPQSPSPEAERLASHYTFDPHQLRAYCTDHPTDASRQDRNNSMEILSERAHPATAIEPLEPGYRKNWNPSDWYQDVAIAEDYDRTRFSSLAGRIFDALEKRALRKILAGLPVGATIIDAPCGTGRLAETLLEAGYRVIGIDISAPMLDVASRKLERFGDRFEAHVRDVKSIEPGEFNADAVLCARVLMHFPLAEQIDFLKKVSSLTEGPVIFNQSVSTPWHRFRRSLKKLLRNQSPASYPLERSDLDNLVTGAGLKLEHRVSVQPLLSEAEFQKGSRHV